MDKLSKELEKIIEGDFGFSIDILEKLKIHNSSLEFYIQNKHKMSIEESGENVYFHIKDKVLKKDINNVLGKSWKEKTRYFSAEEMEKYLQKIDYKGLPLDRTSFAEIEKRIEKI